MTERKVEVNLEAHATVGTPESHKTPEAVDPKSWLPSIPGLAVVQEVASDFNTWAHNYYIVNFKLVGFTMLFGSLAGGVMAFSTFRFLSWVSSAWSARDRVPYRSLGRAVDYTPGPLPPQTPIRLCGPDFTNATDIATIPVQQGPQIIHLDRFVPQKLPAFDDVQLVSSVPKERLLYRSPYMMPGGQEGLRRLGWETPLSSPMSSSGYPPVVDISRWVQQRR